tara:strand:+ start:531 stop:680 length:150 start_codon:yes stop_codon:yes gene_type:complete
MNNGMPSRVFRINLYPEINFGSEAGGRAEFIFIYGIGFMRKTRMRGRKK